MSKVKTKDLIGPALDWAVEVAELSDRLSNLEQAGSIALRNVRRGISKSTNWALGGDIIDRERIEFTDCTEYWSAATPNRSLEYGYGCTHLIAAMRCYVISKLGEVVEVPDELVEV